MQKQPKQIRSFFGRLFSEWRWMGRYIRPHRVSILLYLFLGIVGVVMGLGVSVMTKNLVDLVVGKNGEMIAITAAVVIALALGEIPIRAVSNRIAAKVQIKVTNELRADLMESLLATKYEHLSAYHSGEILNRAEGDVTQIANGAVTLIPNLILRSVQFLGVFSIIFYYDITMALLSLCSAPILVLTARHMMKVMRAYHEKIRNMNGEILSFQEEAFQNIQLLKAFSLSREYYRLLGTLLSRHSKLRLDQSRFSVWMQALMSFLGLAVSYLCYGWGAYQLWKGDISVGVMMMFMQLSTTLTGTFSTLISLLPSVVSTATAAGRMIEITSMEKEMDADATASQALLESARKSGVTLQLRDLTYTYPKSDRPALKNVSMEARAGETVAFVGPSGGGKTTLLRVLLSLVQPQSGELAICSNEDGASLPLSESTRRLCAYVPQGNPLFFGTIASNLRMVAPQATDEALIEALKTADAWDFVSALPNGIETELKEKGGNLSEGQRQRIAIARAVLRNAPILILDEATSALDAETERKVLHQLMKNDPNRICIITTHRESMLAYADRVYEIVGGEMSEQRKKEP